MLSALDVGLSLARDAAAAAASIILYTLFLSTVWLQWRSQSKVPDPTETLRCARCANGQ